MNIDEIINKWEGFGIFNGIEDRNSKLTLSLIFEKFTKHYIDHIEKEGIDGGMSFRIIISIFKENHLWKLEKIVEDIINHKLIIDKIKEIYGKGYEEAFIDFYTKAFKVRKDIEKFI